MAPLTNSQKRYLAQLADRAFNLEAARARGRGESPDTSAAARENWRHTEVASACGKLGLRCASQSDYKLVEAHFLDLLGESGRALKSLMAGQTEARRIAEYKLVEACNQFGFHLAYADKICRAQNHGTGLQDADTNTIWHLVYTIRNRGLARQNAA